MTALPQSGRLEETPLASLLIDLYDARFSGALSVARERVSKRILFRDGTPILAESNLASETLGVQLLDAGKLTREDYSKIVGYVQLKGCKEGKALLDLKLLDPKGLFVALKDQLRKRILECFGWPNGEWKLDPSDLPPADAQAFRLDPRVLVQDGIEAHWSTDRVLTALGERLGRIARIPAGEREPIGARLRSAPGVAKLVELLDGTCTLGEALRRAGAPGALAAAWVLDATGELAYPEDGGCAETGAEPAVDAATDDDFDIEVVADGASLRDAKLAVAAAVKSAPAALSADAQMIAREIATKHGQPDLDHYTLLGVPKNANPADVKRAYFAAAKRLHPDALQRSGLDDLRATANELFARIAKAYSVLSDPASRRDYDRGVSPAEDGEAERIAQAETLYRKGDVLARKGAFKEALQFLAPAVELWSEEADYCSALGWALYKQGKSEPKPAREHLEKAVKLAPKDGIAHYRLGVVLRALGEKDASDRAFARAKQLDPKIKAT
jgi:tetratricopeptide (TPR) repeat protein